MSKQAGCNLKMMTWKGLSDDVGDEVMLKLKPVRGGARNAKRRENIPGGGNSMNKGPEGGKNLLFSGMEMSVRLEKRSVMLGQWLPVILAPYLGHKVPLAHGYLSNLTSSHSPPPSPLLETPCLLYVLQKHQAPACLRTFAFAVPFARTPDENLNIYILRVSLHNTGRPQRCCRFGSRPPQ